MSRPATKFLTAAVLAAVVLFAGIVALIRGRQVVVVEEQSPPPAPAHVATMPTSGLPARPTAVAPAPAPPQEVASARRPQVGTDGSPAAAAAHLDEAALMAKLRSLEGTDPPLTLRLAREGNRRLPDSPDAPERAWMVVKALANMEKFKEARDEAAVMVKRYPGTSWSLDVQRHLLSNPLE